MSGFAEFAAGDGTQAHVGRGKIFVDRLNPTTFARQGSFFAGSCDGYEVEPSSETATKKDMTDATNAIMARIETSREFKLKIDAAEFRRDPLAVFLLGQVNNYTQSSGPIVGETLTTSSVQGLVYWIAPGNRRITAYAVKVGASTKVEGTDYEIDPETGAVYIKPGGSIVDASTVTIDYTKTAIVAGSIYEIIPGTAGLITCEVRFVGVPVNGKIHEATWWRVQMTPSGVLALISEEFQNWSLEGTILKVATPPISGKPYGVVYQR